jgi:hypothetical protein
MKAVKGREKELSSEVFMLQQDIMKDHNELQKARNALKALKSRSAKSNKKEASVEESLRLKLAKEEEEEKAAEAHAQGPIRELHNIVKALNAELDAKKAELARKDLELQDARNPLESTCVLAKACPAGWVERTTAGLLTPMSNRQATYLAARLDRPGPLRGWRWIFTKLCCRSGIVRRFPATSIALTPGNSCPPGTMSRGRIAIKMPANASPVLTERVGWKIGSAGQWKWVSTQACVNERARHMRGSTSCLFVRSARTSGVTESGGSLVSQGALLVPKASSLSAQNFWGSVVGEDEAGYTWTQSDVMCFPL